MQSKMVLDLVQILESMKTLQSTIKRRRGGGLQVVEIGNKWAEIIKQMPGRTENNVKNRFNMMFKNIKDDLY